MNKLCKKISGWSPHRYPPWVQHSKCIGMHSWCARLAIPTNLVCALLVLPSLLHPASISLFSILVQCAPGTMHAWDRSIATQVMLLHYYVIHEGFHYWQLLYIVNCWDISNILHVICTCIIIYDVGDWSYYVMHDICSSISSVNDLILTLSLCACVLYYIIISKL